MKEHILSSEGTESVVSRRKFLKNSVAGATALTLGAELLSQTTDAQATGIPTRPLGKTGVNVSILCLGGWHIGAIQDKNEAVKIMHAAIDEGVTLTNVEAVVDFWLQRIYQNFYTLEARDLVIQYLSTDVNGNPTPLLLGPDYEPRIRAVIGYILTAPQAQKQ